MTDDKRDDIFLDDLFAAGRVAAPEPSPEFLAQILSDAEEVQAGFAPPRVVRAKPGVFASILASIGGWPSVAGLATATVAGVWIGFSSPEAVDDLASGYLGISEEIELTDLMPSFDTFLQEG